MRFPYFWPDEPDEEKADYEHEARSRSRERRQDLLTLFFLILCLLAALLVAKYGPEIDQWGARNGRPFVF